MTCVAYHSRATPAVDEHVNTQRLAHHLAHGTHPCVAVILAYEDATGGGQGGTGLTHKHPNGAANETAPNHRTHLQRREPHIQA